MKQLVLTLTILLNSSSIFFCKTLEEIQEEAHHDTLRTFIYEICTIRFPLQGSCSNLIKKVELLIQAEENFEYKKQFLLLHSLLNLCNGGFISPNINDIFIKENYEEIDPSDFFLQGLIMARVLYVIAKEIIITSIVIPFLKMPPITPDNLQNTAAVIFVYRTIKALCGVISEHEHLERQKKLLQYYLQQPEFKVLQKLYKEEKEKHKEHLKYFYR